MITLINSSKTLYHHVSIITSCPASVSHFVSFIKKIQCTLHEYTPQGAVQAVVLSPLAIYRLCGSMSHLIVWMHVFVYFACLIKMSA